MNDDIDIQDLLDLVEENYTDYRETRLQWWRERGYDHAGEVSTTGAVRWLTAHVEGAVTLDLHAALRGKVDHYLWRSAGLGSAYWVPGLVASADVAGVLRVVMKDLRTTNPAEALDRIQSTHKGIGDGQIALVPAAYCEIDHLSRDEQVKVLTHLAETIGVPWGMWVDSGGKSVHAYIRFSEPLLADDPLRLEIQKLLIVALAGDTMITNPSRLMRWPDYDGGPSDRYQPVVFIEDSSVAAEDLRDRLRAYLRDHLDLGDETSINKAFRALQLAHDLDLAARPKDEPEEPEKLLQMAARLRASRGVDVDLHEAHALLGRGAQAAASTPSSARPSKNKTGTTKVEYLPGIEMDSLLSRALGRRVGPPCCGGQGRAGAVLDNRVWCHRHDLLFVRDEVALIKPSPKDPDDETSVPTVRVIPEIPPMEEEVDEVYETFIQARDLLEELLQGRPPLVPTAVLEHLFDDLGAWSYDKGQPGSSVLSMEEGNRKELPFPEETQEEPSSVDLHALQEYGDHGYVACDRGTSLARVEPNKQRVKILGGAACLGHKCPHCGPRMLAALRAASTVLGRQLDCHECVVLDLKDRTSEYTRTMKRLWDWARGHDHDDRDYIGFAIDPNTVRMVLVFPEGKDPGFTAAITKQISRHRLDGRVAEHGAGRLGEVLGDLVSEVDLNAWSRVGRDANILRGREEGLRSRVSALRTALVDGSVRRRVLGQADKSWVPIQTTAPEVRDLIAERTKAKVVHDADGIQYSPEAHDRHTSYLRAFQPVGKVFEELLADDTIRRTRSPRLSWLVKAKGYVDWRMEPSARNGRMDQLPPDVDVDDLIEQLGSEGDILMFSRVDGG